MGQDEARLAGMCRTGSTGTVPFSSTIFASTSGCLSQETNTSPFFSFKSLPGEYKIIPAPQEESVSGQQVWKWPLPTWKYSEDLSTAMSRERQMPPIASPQPNQHRLSRLTNTGQGFQRMRSGQKLNQPCVSQLSVKSVMPGVKSGLGWRASAFSLCTPGRAALGWGMTSKISFQYFAGNMLSFVLIQNGNVLVCQKKKY